MNLVRPAIVALTLCLLFRVAASLYHAEINRIPTLGKTVAKDIHRIEQAMGTAVAIRARKWMGNVRKVIQGDSVQPISGKQRIGISEIESDLFTRLGDGLGKMKTLFLLNLEMAAGRLAAILASLPLGALALSIGLSNGYASRHIRQHRLAPESSFLFRSSLASLWLPFTCFALYVTLPIPMDPEAVVRTGWALAGIAVFAGTALFKKRL